jgi:hypothetical protein
MTFRLLRSRFAALALLFASPGFAGLAVDAAHPCPEKAPWTVEKPGHHHDAPATDHHDCKCVGTCQTAVAAAVDASDGLTAVAPVFSYRSPSYHLQLVDLGRPQDRLPPATAPPAV